MLLVHNVPPLILIVFCVPSNVSPWHPTLGRGQRLVMVVCRLCRRGPSLPHLRFLATCARVVQHAVTRWGASGVCVSSHEPSNITQRCGSGVVPLTASVSCRFIASGSHQIEARSTVHQANSKGLLPALCAMYRWLSKLFTEFDRCSRRRSG